MLLALTFCPPLTFSPSFSPSVPSLSLARFSLSPLFLPSFSGIGGSISFKAHVKGTVCHFQRPLCPLFLSPNLVSPKHFPIARPSRPFFSQLPPHLSRPLTLPTVLNTFILKSLSMMSVSADSSAIQHDLNINVKTC